MFAHKTEDKDLSPGERIATPRLVLRAPTMNDVTAMVSLANNVRIAENTASLPHPYGEEDAENWITRNLSRTNKSGHGFLVCLKDDPAPVIGCAGWGKVPGLELPQVGYWIGEPYWGNGYATEAAQAMIDHAFTIGGLDVVGCGCRVTNAASRRVIDKCGFQYEGLGMIRFRYHGGSLPILKYRMDRAAWTSLKAWGAR